MRRQGRKLFIFAFAALLLSLPFAYGLMAERVVIPQADPMNVLATYLQASYARDYNKAYGYISVRDRRHKDERSYVRERGAFTGFTLEAARELASAIEVVPLEIHIEQDRAHIRSKIKLPDASKVGPLLLHWDSDRLNQLSRAERAAIIQTLEKMRRDQTLEMVEGEEAFDLIKEGGTWRIFLDWAAGIKIKFLTTLPSDRSIEAKLAQATVITRPGELFHISLKIRNNSSRELTARIGHLVDPQRVRDYLDLVECGFLLPIRLLPQKEEEFTSTYLLRGGLPEKVRELTVTYAIAMQ